MKKPTKSRKPLPALKKRKGLCANCGHTKARHDDMHGYCEKVGCSGKECPCACYRERA